MTYLAAICALQLAVIAWLTVDRARERREVARERADLYQRMQAPAHAVTAHYNATVPEAAPPAVLPDSDDDFWESREALAERLAAQEVNGDG